MELLHPHQLGFPPLNQADEDGLLAFGGDLRPARLVAAYAQGIFPWYDEAESPILWWSPDPRFVLFPQALKVSKTMQQVLRRRQLTITTNQCFTQVMQACASQPRPGQDGTWIGQSMIDAYQRLHQLGIAHSVEAWQEGQLVGGLYGIRMGQVFFGESMFARASNASKAAFITYVQHLQSEGVQLVDCQTYTPHLESLGAAMMARNDFATILKQLIPPATINHWLSLANRT